MLGEQRWAGLWTWEAVVGFEAGLVKRGLYCSDRRCGLGTAVAPGSMLASVPAAGYCSTLDASKQASPHRLLLACCQVDDELMLLSIARPGLQVGLDHVIRLRGHAVHRARLSAWTWWSDFDVHVLHFSHRALHCQRSTDPCMHARPCPQARSVPLSSSWANYHIP